MKYAVTQADQSPTYSMETNNTLMNQRHPMPARTQFVRTCMMVFILLTGILFSTDFVPETHVSAALNATTTTKANVVASIAPIAPTVVHEVTVPTRIRIKRIGVDASIVTPKSANIEVLDRALLSGAVHFPGSALAGDTGNMLIFGHSSYLPVVINKAFQTFNGLGKLTSGDVIEVLSTTHRYTYIVDTVTLTRAENAEVPLTVSRPTLTLATCNTFGAKQERWVVTAHLSTDTPI
jgi:LPXTG-site transpeptidase (sortase) family protein